MRIIILFFCLFIGLHLSAQQHNYQFKEGFDARECDDMLYLNTAFLDTVRGNIFTGFLSGYRFLYRSPNIGMDNAWDLWIRSDSTVVIMLRGTTADSKSLLADFYCAMIPATGHIVLKKSDTVDYQLATDSKAAVHAGWLIGFAYLSRDIRPRIDSLYQAGYHNYLVSGHSQGGALSYFISSWMWHMQRQQLYPQMRIKTYASASPKIGNMYFAYDYDNVTRSVWTYSIVNSADVVPETPFTTQQIETDMNKPNPFMNLNAAFKKMGFIKRLVLRHAYNQMRKGASKSSKAYQKYLGGYASKMVLKAIPGIQLPEPVNTTYFVRPGVSITLLANAAYYQHFEPVKDGPYYHHGIKPYRFLLRQYYPME